MISHEYTPEDALRILMTKLSPYPEQHGYLPKRHFGSRLTYFKLIL